MVADLVIESRRGTLAEGLPVQFSAAGSGALPQGLRPLTLVYPTLILVILSTLYVYIHVQVPSLAHRSVAGECVSPV